MHAACPPPSPGVSHQLTPLPYLHSAQVCPRHRPEPREGMCACGCGVCDCPCRKANSLTFRVAISLARSHCSKVSQSTPSCNRSPGKRVLSMLCVLVSGATKATEQQVPTATGSSRIPGCLSGLPCTPTALFITPTSTRIRFAPVYFTPRPRTVRRRSSSRTREAPTYFPLPSRM